MSKRVENLDMVVDFLDEVEIWIDDLANRVWAVLGDVREKVAEQRDLAVQNEAVEEEFEKRVKDTTDTVVNIFKKFVNNPNVKNFYDVVVNPESHPNNPWDFVTDKVNLYTKPEHPVEKVEPTREEKIDAVRKAYKEKFNIAVWPATEFLSDDMIDRVYTFMVDDSK